MGLTAATFAPLAAPGFVQAAALSTLVYVAGYAALGGFSKAMEAKRKAWLLTLMCSLGMSLGSAPYVWALATEHGFVTAPFVYGDDALSLLVMAWFMCFLVLDLLLGVFQYPKEIGVLTGYFHHTLYMAMCVWAVVNAITISAVATMIMEIPTFVLALGRVDRRCRSDAAFGLSFLLTRIVFLGFYIYRLMQDRERIVIWPVCVPAMVLHLFWFKGFIAQQRRLATPRTGDAGATAAGGASGGSGSGSGSGSAAEATATKAMDKKQE
jgi:hypothetical protein